MIRVVALRKAALAGAAGALVWEVVLRALILAGVPLLDIVHVLGTLAYPHGQWPQWWAAGLTAHILVGIAWAVFYAYFFWARLDLRPALQGLAFAALPAVLAFLLAAPQLRLMHMETDVVQLGWGTFRDSWTAPGIAGMLIGHAIFGLVVGTLYTHPVGYPVSRESELRPRLAPARRPSPEGRSRYGPASFMFATGIEGSYPTIENGRWRRDQMLSTWHYQRWQEDFELAREIGVSHLRYGPPLHLVFTGPGQYDWSLVDEPMAELQRAGPEPIVDLCHFGLPDWLGNFQNPDIAGPLGEYATAFAERYPWVRFYTPVNEVYVCARMSAMDGAWNEQLRDDGAFLRAVINMAGATVSMEDAILRVRPDAIFINAESSEFTQPCCPDPEIQRAAWLENERRFLPLDLIYAHPLSDDMRKHVREHGINDEQLAPFMRREVPRRSVLGVDYYEWNERLIDQNGNAQTLGELFGWHVIANQYWQRYGRTMMHTETNRTDADDAPRWLWRQWHNVQLLRESGVPLIGFTWYSLTDQIDWSNGITEALGLVYPVGLADLNRDARSVGLSYKYLIDLYADEPEYRECPALKELID